MIKGFIDILFPTSIPNLVEAKPKVFEKLRIIKIFVYFLVKSIAE